MDLYIKITEDKGRGVFANKDFSTGELIEVCPVIIIPANETKYIDQTIMYHYYFSWGEEEGAIVLGYGSMYNHSYSPNARFEMDLKNKLALFYCIKPIKKDEEIMTNYNGNPKDKTHYDL